MDITCALNYKGDFRGNPCGKEAITVPDGGSAPLFFNRTFDRTNLVTTLASYMHKMAQTEKLLHQGKG